MSLKQAEILQQLEARVKRLRENIDLRNLFESQTFFALTKYLENACATIETVQETIKSCIGGMFALAREHQSTRKKPRMRINNSTRLAFL